MSTPKTTSGVRTIALRLRRSVDLVVHLDVPYEFEPAGAVMTRVDIESPSLKDVEGFAVAAICELENYESRDNRRTLRRIASVNPGGVYDLMVSAQDQLDKERQYILDERKRDERGGDDD